MAGKAHNWIKFEENEEGRSLEARFTDHAVGSLSMPLRTALLGRGGAPNLIPATDEMLTHVIESQATLAGAHDAAAFRAPQLTSGSTEPKTQVSELNAIALDESAQLRDLFHRDGDKLTLDITDVKGENTTEIVRRITYTLLLALEADGQPHATKSEIYQVIRDAGHYDGNTHRVFQNTEDLSIEGDNVRLRSTGRRTARGFLREIFDPNIVVNRKPSAPKRAKSSRNTASDATPNTKSASSRQRSTSKNAQALISDWKASEGLVDVHALLNNTSAATKGTVALWAISKLRGKEDIVTSSGDLSAFVLGAFAHKVSEAGLRRALKSADGVINTEGSMFRITPTGVRIVERIIEQGPVDASQTSSKRPGPKGDNA